MNDKSLFINLQTVRPFPVDAIKLYPKISQTNVSANLLHFHEKLKKVGCFGNVSATVVTNDKSPFMNLLTARLFLVDVINRDQRHTKTSQTNVSVNLLRFHENIAAIG